MSNNNSNQGGDASDLAARTARLAVSGSNDPNKSGGGGGGPAFSFKSSFNPGAHEFVPSGGPSAAGPAAGPAAAAPAFDPNAYGGHHQQQFPHHQQQRFQQNSYYGQQFPQQQQQYYGAGYNQQPQYQQQPQQYQQHPQQYQQQRSQQPYQQPQQQQRNPPQQQQQHPGRPIAAAPVQSQPKTVSLPSSAPSAPAKVVSLSTTAKPAAAPAPAKAPAPAPAVAPAALAPKPKPADEPKKSATPAPASASASPARDKSTASAATAAAAVDPSDAAAFMDDDEDCDPVSLGRKEHLNIIFLGHVDAGKSTMGGHILFLTGMVDKRTMEKYEREAKELGRESWYLSWALDLNQEERNKGKTTEYGRGYFETERRRFTIIDAPGHKTFVPSMIEGAAQADVGILVISARKGEFETGFEKGGQTREHALLAKTVGVKHLIVVINKMDDPTVGFSKDRYMECVDKISPFLKQVGYQKSDVDFMPVSGFTGANLRDRIDSSVCDWHSGPALLEMLNDMKIDRDYKGPLLMPIAGKLKDMGTVVMGKLESGHVKKNQTVLIMPNKRTAEVTAIYQEENEVVAAYTGDNVRMRLRGVEEEDVLSGFVICHAKKPVHSVTVFEAQLAIFEYKSIICAGYSAVMHIHTATEEITISALLHMIDKKTGRKSKHPPKFVKKGDSCVVRIETSQSVCVETFAEYKQLGRFTLRDEGVTIAVGKVLRLVTDTV